MILPERYLYHIWDARHFVPDMETVNKKRVKILFPGHFNTNVGPDYHHAVLEVNGQIKRGDIEIHLKTSDWIAHQHHDDPIYNNVILHVVMEHNSKQPFTITERGNAIDILELKAFLDHDISKLIPPAEPLPDREPLCRFFAGLQPDQVRILLEQFGMERLNRRIARFQAELHFNDIDQIIYQSIMEAMGYRQNQFPFLILAEQISFKQLQTWKQSGMSKDEMTAIFICSSGLISSIKQEDEACYWQDIFKKQHYFRQQIPCEWNLFRIRPAHHPLKRFQMTCNFLFQALDKKLLEQIHPIYLHQPGRTAKELEEAFYQVINMGSIISPNQSSWGRNMIRLLIINALLPIEINYARRIKNADLIKYLEDMYHTYPGLPENVQIRDMKHFMTPNQSKQLKGSAQRQLGLQQLYREYCLVHDCDSCIQHKSKLIHSL